MNTSPIPIGAASVTGWTASLTAFGLAIVNYLVTNPGEQQLLGTIVGAGVGLIALIVTQAGRYIQAREQIRTTTNPVIAAPTDAAIHGVPITTA
jgi:hypothetical protein